MRLDQDEFRRDLGMFSSDHKTAEKLVSDVATPDEAAQRVIQKFREDREDRLGEHNPREHGG